MTPIDTLPSTYGRTSSLTICFADVAVLPATPIEQNGSVGREFRARGLDTLRDAAAWLRAVPYGRNTVHDSLAVFRDGFGTCTTKHAAIVTLAEELAVELQLCWGLYALDGDILAGARAVLADAGIPFVPNIHCFVAFGGHYVDLTAGNCTGKLRQIENYLAVTTAHVGDSETDAIRHASAELCASDLRFAHVTTTDVLDILAACVATNSVLCTRAP